jgi:PIN domain nuclease of toxin-antitoxin system
LRLLLDSHSLLWWLGAEPLLSKETRRLIASTDNHVAISVVSVWELLIKQTAGRLNVEEDLPAAIRRERFEMLDITFDAAVTAATLPQIHRDPFDRMLVAQAKLGNLTLVTRDRYLTRYGINTISP